MSLKLQLDGEAWSAVLADLSETLGKEGEPLLLCLIGSAACIFGGMEGRTSADLDIWIVRRWKIWSPPSSSARNKKI
jgi:hypothetical protein